MTYSNRERQRTRLAIVFGSVLLGLFVSTLGFSQHVPDAPEHANVASVVDAHPSPDESDPAPPTSTDLHRERPPQEYASHPQARPGDAERYIESNGSGYEWFVHAANSHQGIPFLLLRLLPEMEPGIFGDPEEPFQKFGFVYTQRDRQVQRPLPTGLAWDPMSNPAHGQSASPIRSVSLACAACHLGHVRAPGGVLDLVGAPNTQIDVRAWRYAFERLVQKRLSSNADRQAFADEVKRTVQQKPEGYFYGESTTAREMEERQIFAANILPIMSTLAQRIQTNKLAVDLQRISSYAKDNRPPLNGGSVGQSDGSGDLIPKLLLLDTITSAQAKAVADGLSVEQTQQAVIDALERFLGKNYSAIVADNATVTDNLSTWQQGVRSVAQLDGSVRSPFFRNIAAILAVAGTPDNVNASNAAVTARFLHDLPPPAYPFSIDVERIEQGEKLFQQHCAVCHFQGNPAVYNNLNTDMNRAVVLRQPTVNLFLRHFRASIPDGFTYTDSDGREIEPLQLAADEVLNANRANTNDQGYIAGGLEGIWARAPYLHNGSVPTLWHLLRSSGQRPRRFVRGSIDYDRDRVGFAWRLDDLALLQRKDPIAAVYDCDNDGCSHSGHDQNIVVDGQERKLDWSDDADGLNQLLEYLKTL